MNPQSYPIVPVDSARNSLVWGWWLVGGACVLAILPFFGMLAWFIGPPLIVAAFVLSIVAMSKGRTGSGVALLLFSITAAPATILFAPIISGLLYSSVMAPKTPPTIPGIESGFPGQNR